jgi:hypothetical protein
MGRTSLEALRAVALLVLVVLCPLSFAAGQEAESGADYESVAAEDIAEVETADTADPLQDEVNKANNPLADLIAINLHNYFAPRLNGLPDASANTMFLRAVTPFWRLIPRVSLPIRVAPATAEPADPSVASISGIGDLNVFATFVVTPDDSPAMLGIGPIYTAPTASNEALGNGKHEIGAAAITVYAKGIILIGGLVNYQIGVGGDSNEPRTQYIAAQPFFIVQLGQGYYLRSSPIWFFDLEKPTYAVPFGLGAGKAIPTDKVVYNLFIEPQFSMAVRGIGQPTIQVFAGMNIQFKTGRKEKKKQADRVVNQLRAEHSLRTRMH